MRTFLVGLTGTFLASAKLAAALVFSNAVWGITCDYPMTNNVGDPVPVLSYYAPGTNTAIKLLGTSTLGTPLENWPTLATWTNWTLITNGATIQMSNTVTVSFAQWFFYLNPTNVFGDAPLGLYGIQLQTGPPWPLLSSATLRRNGP